MIYRHGHSQCPHSSRCHFRCHHHKPHLCRGCRCGCVPANSQQSYPRVTASDIHSLCVRHSQPDLLVLLRCLNVSVLGAACVQITCERLYCADYTHDPNDSSYEDKIVFVQTSPRATPRINAPPSDIASIHHGLPGTQPETRGAFMATDSALHQVGGTTEPRDVNCYAFRLQFSKKSIASCKSAILAVIFSPRRWYPRNWCTAVHAAPWPATGVIAIVSFIF